MDETILHLHIPKVGGTTLRNILYAQYRGEQQSKGEDGFFRSGVYYFPWDVVAPPDPVVPENVRRALGREDLRAVLGHFWFGIHAYVSGPSTYITLLRDPADRLISLYFLFITLPGQYDFPHGMSFHEFVTSERYREAFNDQTRRIAGREPGVGAGDRTVLNDAQKNLQHNFRVVGTMERFEETLILLKRQLRWEKPISYYPERQNPTRPRVRNLPRKTLDAIRERNALDYELYEVAQDMLSNAVLAAGPEFAAEVEALQESLLARYEKIARRKAENEREQKAKAREAASMPTAQVGSASRSDLLGQTPPR